MAWVAIVDGRALEVRWMVNEEGCNVSANAERYHDILKQVWEEIRYCCSKVPILANARWQHGLT